MGNFLKSATAQPSSMPSGGTANVTLRYESDDGGPVTLVHTAGFNVDHDPIVLDAGTSSTTVPITITRTSSSLDSCDLWFVYVTSRLAPVGIT